MASPRSATPAPAIGFGICRRNIERADSVAVASLGRFGVATVPEAFERGGLMKPYLRPAFPGARLAAGELGLDLYGMREPLARAGLRYRD